MELIQIFSLIGFAISLYTYITEKKVAENPAFKPFCDISDYISCSKPMRSPYANIFFISNALVGMMYYVVMFILAMLHASKLLLIASIGGACVSIFLAYLLYFKIRALCLLCTTLYVINGILLYLSITMY